MAIFTLATTNAGLKAPRFTGTFTTNGTTSVVGVGTEFTISLVGHTFRLVGNSTDYTIASVTDATHLTTTVAVPAGSNQTAFLSSNQHGLIDANFHSLGSAALADSNDFQPYDASTTLLGNATTGTGSLVRAASPAITTPTIASLVGNKIYPATDDVAALQFCKANGSTSILTIDTTNERVGVGTTPTAQFHVRGSSPNSRYEVARTGGGVAFEFFDLYATSTTSGLSTCFGKFGVYGNLNSAPTSPACGYLYLGADSDTSYGNNALRLYPGKKVYVTGTLGVGTLPSAAKAEIADTAEQLRLAYSSTYYASFTVSNTGNLTISPNGGGLTLAAHLTLSAKNIVTDTSTGTKIGTAGGSSGQKLGFFGATPVAQPLFATGASHTVDELITVLQNLGLLRQS